MKKSLSMKRLISILLTLNLSVVLLYSDMSEIDLIIYIVSPPCSWFARVGLIQVLVIPKNEVPF